MPSTAASAVGISSHGEALTTSAIVAEAVTGSHMLQIKGYSLTKGLGNGKFITSSTFSVGGHGWYIRYYPDGFGLDSAGWISVFLQHDPSAADACAAVDVKALFKFILLDDVGESVPATFSQGFSMTTFSSKNQTWGIPKFVERKALEESSSYLKDDCLRLRCDITVSREIRTEPTAVHKQFVTVPPPNMHLHFGRLFTCGEGMDVTFHVAGEVFEAHRCVLAARSSVFKAELFGPMKEKDMNCIRIDEIDARAFRAMLHFIYTDTMPDICKEDELVVTQHVLEAADRYDLERLKLICEDKLCNCIDTSTVATTLSLAERHGCHELQNACFEFLKSATHLKTAMETEGFNHLMTTCPSIVKELILAKVATSP